MKRASCRALAILTVLFLALALPAQAAKEKDIFVPTSPEDFELVAVGTVDKIGKSGLITLSNDKTYELAGIRIPFTYDPLVQKYLQDTLLNKQVGIYIPPGKDAEAHNRFGDLIAQVMTEKGVWVQADLVSQGKAWAFNAELSSGLSSSLYKFEDIARNSRIGLWRNTAYTIKDDDTIRGTTGSFQIYEGKVKGISPKKGLTYVYFGEDPDTDFTITLKKKEIDSRLLSRASRAAFNPAGWVGHRVRVRGWVENFNGPMITVIHPEQIEILIPPEEQQQPQE